MLYDVCVCTCRNQQKTVSHHPLILFVPPSFSTWSHFSRTSLLWGAPEIFAGLGFCSFSIPPTLQQQKKCQPLAIVSISEPPEDDNHWSPGAVVLQTNLLRQQRSSKHIRWKDTRPLLPSRNDPTQWLVHRHTQILRCWGRGQTRTEVTTSLLGFRHHSQTLAYMPTMTKLNLFNQPTKLVAPVRQLPRDWTTQHMPLHSRDIPKRQCPKTPPLPVLPLDSPHDQPRKKHPSQQ